MDTSAIPYFSSSLDKMKWTAGNATSYLNPSPRDLLLAIPRVVHRAGTFAFFTLPEHLDSLLSNRYGVRIIPEATAGGVSLLATTPGAAFVPQDQAAGAMAGATAAVGGGDTMGGVESAMGLNSVRGFGGILSYLTSKWALSCFTMV